MPYRESTPRSPPADRTWRDDAPLVVASVILALSVPALVWVLV